MRQSSVKEGNYSAETSETIADYTEAPQSTALNVTDTLLEREQQAMV